MRNPAFIKMKGKNHLKRLNLTIWTHGLFLALIALGVFLLPTPGSGSLASAASNKTVKFWVQVMDSCQQALPGAALTITGPNFKQTTGALPGKGVKQVDAVHGKCPLQRGNCIKVPLGCTSFTLPVPASGSAKYTIVESKVPRYFAPCLHNKCPGGPERVIVIVDSTGKASATTIENGHRGDRRVYPTGGTYSGRPTDPAVLHNWENCRANFCYTSYH
jgi:hypothetical protein